jgi:hypothetical protein
MTAPAQLSLALDTPAPAGAPRPAHPGHRYEANRDSKEVCRRCGIERRHAPTGRRKGFRVEWRVLVDGKWEWTTAVPPCVVTDRPARRPR